MTTTNGTSNSASQMTTMTELLCALLCALFSLRHFAEFAYSKKFLSSYDHLHFDLDIPQADLYSGLNF